MKRLRWSVAMVGVVAALGFAAWLAAGGTLPLPVAYVLGLWPRTGSYSMGGVEIDVVVDEELVPHYELPPLLRADDGSPVATPEDWSIRRAEILEAFQVHVYGRTPQVPGPIRIEVLSRSDNALAGNAVRVQARVQLLGPEGPHVDVLGYRPRSSTDPVPTFVAWNFQGNHTVHADVGIRMPESPVPAGGFAGGVRPAEDADRGSASTRWPIDEILARGYGFVTAYPGDFLLDDADLARSGLLGDLATGVEQEQWGAIGGWAFGLSRVLDWIESEAGFDGSRVAVLGHSRMGKAALWAGAQDERFALVISNDSGCAGAALSRRRFGESVSTIQALFSAWALHGAGSPLPPAFPSVGSVSAGAVGHHLRAGHHDLTQLDWSHFLEFADRHLRN